MLHQHKGIDLMCAAATARSRRRQARNGYNHLAPRQRPGFKIRDAMSSKKRLEQRIATERRIKAGKK